MKKHNKVINLNELDRVGNKFRHEKAPWKSLGVSVVEFVQYLLYTQVPYTVAISDVEAEYQREIQHLTDKEKLEKMDFFNEVKSLLA